MRPFAPLLLLMAGASTAPDGGRDGAGAAPGADRAEYVVYVAEEGDRLSDLAERHFLNPEDWRKARALNGLRQDAIPAGTVLRLDPAWLKREPISAEVVAFRGESSIRRGETNLPVRRGERILEGDVIRTGPIGFLTLRLADGSEISVPTNSSLRVLRLRGYALGNMVDRRLLIEQGSVDSRVTPMGRPGSRYEVTTPVSVAAVRGTEFRVTFTPGSGRATTEVLEGRVGVLALGPSRSSERVLPAGQGVVVTSAGVGAAEPLLPPPILEGAAPLAKGRRLLIPVRPEARVMGLRLELATDEGFTDRVVELVSEDGGFDLGTLPPGLYHARLRAISRSGLAGRPAKFTVQTGQSLALAATDGGRHDGGTAPLSRTDGGAMAILGDRPAGLAGFVTDVAAAAEEAVPLLAELSGGGEGDADETELPLTGAGAPAAGGGGSALSASAWGRPLSSVPAPSVSARWASFGSGGAFGGGWGSPGALSPGGGVPATPAPDGSQAVRPGALVPGAQPLFLPSAPLSLPLSPGSLSPSSGLESSQLPVLVPPSAGSPGLSPLPDWTPAAPSSPGAAGIPEPRTWWMMILGFVAVGLAARRRVRPAGRGAGVKG